MATVYHAEGNFENAYILYFKFMTLFLEKILTHPEYKAVPAQLKRSNQEKLKEVLPLTEKLKSKLFDRYQAEYTQFLAAKADRVRREAEQRAREIQRNKMRASQVPNASLDAGMAQLDISSSIPPMPSAPDSDSMLDQVVYPNDFPSQPTNKSNLPAGLLLPDSNKATPKFDRNLKPSDSLIEGNLRCVLVPADTMAKFLSLAGRNTTNNVETCGILAGRLV